MEFTKLEALVELSSPTIPVSRVIKTITDNLESWKVLIDSLSRLPPGGGGGGDDDKDGLLIALVKVLGKVSCEDAVTVLEEDEIVSTGAAAASDGGGGEEDEVSREELARVLRTVCHAELFSVLTGKAATWSMTKRFKDEDCKQRNEEILTSLHNLCQLLMQIMPLTAKESCANLVLTAIGILSGAIVELPQVLEGFQNIQESISEMNLEIENASVKRNYGFSQEHERLLHEREPPSNFRTIPIIPTIKELLEDKSPFLRPNLVKGNYKDSEQYLDVQFRLLREDFVHPLRKGVENFLESKEKFMNSVGRRGLSDANRNSSVRLYNGVVFLERVVSSSGVSSYLFKLPASLVNKVNWEKSKRLLQGSLVLLTSDLCTTAIFATVLAPYIDRTGEDWSASENESRREEISRGILRVSIEDGAELIQSTAPYVMLECEAFFEAYRYNLDILQKMKLAEFPLQRFFVSPSTSVPGSPSYFYKNEFSKRPEEENGDDLKIRLPFASKLSSTDGQISNHKPCWVSVKDTESWPSLEIQQNMGLDENQYKAFRAAITSEFAIIQGPPGTGKTWIGQKIVETILLNKTSNRAKEGCSPNTPILVVCYTNHALDQFLELLNHRNGVNVVRVGGRCKSQSLQECTLAEKRTRLQHKISEFHRIRRNWKAGLEWECTDEYGDIDEYLLRQEMRDRRYELPPVTELMSQMMSQKRILHQANEYVEVSESTLKRVQNDLQNLTSLKDMIHFYHLDRRVCQLLENAVPKTLIEPLMIADAAFLGLKKKTFREVNFSAEKHFQVIFQIRTPHIDTETSGYNAVTPTAPLTQSDSKVTVQQTKEEEIDFNELIEEDEQEPDIDDLVDSDECSEDEENVCHRCLEFPTYLYQEMDYTLEDMFKIRRNADMRGATAYHPEMAQPEQRPVFLKSCKDCMELKHQLDNETNNRIVTRNVLTFLSLVFEYYKRGFLDLPDISKYLQEDNNADVMPLKRRNPQTKLLKMSERWALYFHVANQAIEFSREVILDLESQVHAARQRVNSERHKVDGILLNEADIIGMTTTGASKYHDLLEITKPEIVIIEEAAEILESHTVTSLTFHCKHLVLIGDHLQLRPSTNVYHLANKFHLDVSLFERMINNDMNLWSLTTQHRMRPEIADLIVGPIYPELRNHESVFQFPDVRGVTKNVFLISHDEKEEEDKDMLSKSNAYEADFITAFCYYLIQQGYDSDKITILTTYTGQMFLLKKRINKECENVRITCIDNYQGEENDIILLSLVRSNDEGRIGFVGVDNRICVALSRAKHGLFIMGNIKSLTRRSGTWKKIHEKLIDKGNCGDSLTLRCQRHGTVTRVRHGNDFYPLELGGCGLQPCDFKLDCGHICVLKCHGFDQDHRQYKCKEKCERLCVKGLHPCGLQCHQKCLKCEAKIIMELKCGHQKEMNCGEDPNNEACEVIVSKILQRCGHQELLPCHVNDKLNSCKRKARIVLIFGSIKEVNCHRDKKYGKCKKMVEKNLVPCGHLQYIQCSTRPDKANCLAEVDCVFSECSHEKKMLCWKTKTAKCEEPCNADLKCGHVCRLSCHVNDDDHHEKYLCRSKCQRQCDAGKHKCQSEHKCHLPCPPCSMVVKKSLPCNPEHTGFLACHDDGKNFKCQFHVDRELNCGHVIRMKCGDSVEVEGRHCRQRKLMKCAKCNHERYVLCCFANSLGCIQQGCGQAYPRSRSLNKKYEETKSLLPNNNVPIDASSGDAYLSLLFGD